MDDAKSLAVERWLIKAQHDLLTAKTMLKTEPSVTDMICFHAQQCVEKSLKAFLVASDVQVERTHYLPRLVEICTSVDSSFAELADLAAELTDYAVTNRYPDYWQDIPVEEAAEAVGKAELVFDVVRKKLNRA